MSAAMQKVAYTKSRGKEDRRCFGRIRQTMVTQVAFEFGILVAKGYQGQWEVVLCFSES